MIITEAIILAGGFGKRLSDVVSDLPKPMAPIGQKPFLEIIISQLFKNQIKKIILSTGYKSNIIESYFKKTNFSSKIKFSIETAPLGTGGAIKKALEHATNEHVVVVNGDTFLEIDIQKMFSFHITSKADLTLSLKRIKHANRYGEVIIDSNNKILSFNEKKELKEGLINTGFMIINKKILNKMCDVFSIEYDFLTKLTDAHRFYGYISDGYFIDIGTPEDYEKAQKELSNR